MNLPSELLAHAWDLVRDSLGELPTEVALRRSVSASYYALFHRINGDAVALIAPNVAPETNHRIQRWFEHSEMKRVCLRFLPDQLAPPLRELVGARASADLQNVARSFIQLQNARHSADYDLSYALSLKHARDLAELSAGAIEAWSRIANSAEANIFILSLLLWKNWEKERV